MNSDAFGTGPARLFPTPICGVCESAPAFLNRSGLPVRDDACGPVCAACILDLAQAVVNLASVPGICGLLHEPKNSKPQTPNHKP